MGDQITGCYFTQAREVKLRNESKSKNQFPDRLCKCQSNRRVNYGDETRRICGLSNPTETANPNAVNVGNALYILKRYRNIDL